MKRRQQKIWSTVLALLVLGMTHPTGTLAQEDPWSMRHAVLFGMLHDERIEGSSLESESQQELYFRLNGQWRYRLSEQYSVFSQALGFYSTDEVIEDSDLGQAPVRRYLELRQLYFEAQDVVAPGFEFVIGRKRLREASAIWLDQDTTLLGLSLERTRYNFNLGVAEDFRAMRSDKSDYRAEDEDLQRVIFSADLQWQYKNHIGFDYYTLRDRSDASNFNGSASVEGNDFDDPDVRWLNWRFSGERMHGADWQLGYSAHFAKQSGSVVRYTDATTSSSLPVDASLRLVTLTGQTTNTALGKIVGLQWARTSSGEGGEGRFFQTGLESNRLHLQSPRLSLYRFNDAYRPELTNLEVLGVFFAAELSPNTSFGAIFNQFRRPNERLPIGSSRFDAPLQDGRGNLGMGADVVWQYAPRAVSRMFSRQRFRFRISYFDAGSAYQGASAQDSLDDKTTARIEWEGVL